MKDGFYTKDSMFTELLDVANYLKEVNLKTSKELPAMIILEKQLDGMDKHALVGRPQEIIELLEWGISQYSKQNNISFEILIELIQERHKTSKKIILHKKKYDKEDC